VEWDAVELPSQFMENFCWEWEVLQGMTAPMPTRRNPAARTVRQDAGRQELPERHDDGAPAGVFLFDMLLHTDFDASTGDCWRCSTVRQEVAVNFPPSYNRFPNSFSHIFAGGYSAGYYSYKWAEVLSADAYAAFEEAGGANAATGKRFWDEILAVGGSRSALESFRAFRGRDPQMTRCCAIPAWWKKPPDAPTNIYTGGTP
jgi:oligopeptidase A